MNQTKDIDTAQAFATSWNNLPNGSTYTYDQFADWFYPLTEKDIKNKTVLELGCGNASLMMWVSTWVPRYISGVDLGDSVESAKTNMRLTHFENWEVIKDDLTLYSAPEQFDIVYCVGVLHHLENPKAGFDSVIKNTKPGGKFHCWVYAQEGNNLVIYLVDPLRKLVSRLPWWLTKYAVATPLAALFYAYTHLIKSFKNSLLAQKLPLYSYSLWIAKFGFAFHRHVAFDQLVTPRTAYISKNVIEGWLNSDDRIDHTSQYILMRNGNSWKFGGIIKC